MKTDFFEWGPQYSLGIKEIDEQHKQLVEIINELYHAFMKKELDDKLGQILDQLKDYTVYHFGTEEKYFNRYGYENKKQHVAQHKKYIAEIDKMVATYKEKPSAITYKLMNFLRSWLIEHIQGTDARYVKFFKQNGIQ
jgi:hemerythrin-like metal-binding protein